MRPAVVFHKLIVLVVVVVPFLATILAVGLLWRRAVHWSDLVLLAVMYTLVGFGVTVGFHRMLTHRSFHPHPVIKFILLVLGSMSFEGSAIDWAATHIKHHAQADRPGDPHSPLEGFFHAHIGWLLSGMADPHVYCRYLEKDRMVVFISRTFLLWSVLSLLIPFALGGWPGLLWAGLVRMFLTHHAFPRSAFHGLRWWQLDCSGYLIWMLERLGLARYVYRVSPVLQRRRAAGYKGDASSARTSASGELVPPTLVDR